MGDVCCLRLPQVASFGAKFVVTSRCLVRYKQYERVTLGQIKNRTQDGDLVLYIHSKGALASAHMATATWPRNDCQPSPVTRPDYMSCRQLQPKTALAMTHGDARTAARTRIAIQFSGPLDCPDSLLQECRRRIRGL